MVSKSFLLMATLLGKMDRNSRVVKDQAAARSGGRHGRSTRSDPTGCATTTAGAHARATDARLGVASDAGAAVQLHDDIVRQAIVAVQSP
ncbi:MAG: hypothetical protein MUF30_10175 [Burkholderiales bacterium]|nr:hypothetical protein [Burkholderiales bacterium]